MLYPRIAALPDIGGRPPPRPSRASKSRGSIEQFSLSAHYTVGASESLSGEFRRGHRFAADSAWLVGCDIYANALDMRRYPVGLYLSRRPNQSRHADNVAGSPISGAEHRMLFQT